MSSTQTTRTQTQKQTPGNTPVGIAVVDATTIRLDNGVVIPRSDTLGTVTIASLLAAARRREITQLWIHPSTFVNLDYAQRGAWDIQPDPLQQPDAGRYVALVPGTYGRVTLFLPGAKRMRQLSPALARAQNGAELLAALQMLNDLLGVPFDHSSSTTATYLLRHLHSSAVHARIPLDPVQEFLPEIARHHTADHALVWTRPLSSEEKQRRYIHSYDRNKAWLACMSSLACGVGAPEHFTRQGELLAADIKLPGYWRLTDGAADLLSRRPQWLPTIISALPAEQRRAEVWVMSPTIRFLAELAGGELPADFIAEAWLWPEHHQLIQPWYKRMRDAVNTTVERSAEGAPGAGVALALLKDMYVRFLANLKLTARDADRADNPLFRPDIRHAVIATGRAHLLRAVYALAEADIHTWAVSTDAFYITSDEADPLAALAGSSLALSETQIGAYRPKDVAVPLREALDVMACQEAGSKPDLMAFQMWRNGTLPLPSPDDGDEDDFTPIAPNELSAASKRHLADVRRELGLPAGPASASEEEGSSDDATC